MKRIILPVLAAILVLAAVIVVAIGADSKSKSAASGSDLRVTDSAEAATASDLTAEEIQQILAEMEAEEKAVNQ